MRFLKRLLPFAVIVAAALLLIWLPDIVPERYVDLEAFFAGERSRQGLVGYTAASVRYGKPDYAGAWGTDARGIPLAPSTPMAIGDLSTAVTGLLAFDAVRKHRLDLDRPLVDILPELAPAGGRPGSRPLAGGSTDPAPDPKILDAGPTARLFLSQTSGWSRRDFDDRHLGLQDLASAVRLLSSVKPRHVPGGTVDPIETGYQALGLALERSLDLPFAELAYRGVFLPLGMLRSSAKGGEEAARLPQGSSAFFWTPIPKAQELPAWRAPSSGVISTAPDFSRLMAVLLAPGPSGTGPAGKDDLVRLTTPLTPVGTWTWGWELFETKQGKELRISGDTEAFSAVAALWPERQAGIVILAPENNLILSRLILPVLVAGARNILLNDSTEPPLPYGRIAILLAIMAAVHVIALAAQAGSALSWARDVRGRADARGSELWIGIARWRMGLDLLLRLALMAGLPLLAEAFMGQGASWTFFFDREPGLSGWLVAAILLGVFRDIARLSWLRGPSSQVRKIRILLRK